MELNETLGIDVTASPGARSQFDVLVDGALVFSKQARGRFPEDGEVIRLLARTASESRGRTGA